MVRNDSVMIGPNSLPMCFAALRLQRKQAHQDHRRQGDNIRRNRRHRGLQAFERAQHRDGRRDGAVAIEERGAENARETTAIRSPCLMPRSDIRAKNAAFAFVVGAHHDGDAFDEVVITSVQTISDSMPIAVAGVALLGRIERGLQGVELLAPISP